MPYLKMIDDERFVVMLGDTIIDVDTDANVLIEKHGTMAYIG